MTSREIRQQFLDYFRGKGHAIVPSAPVVPVNDPTLMFTNAGMNQFKDVFLATGTRPYRRAADTQKCIRAGGKHNDLDDVGQDTYHHTFFEMLGNWSFGDYFKTEAIQWAWELLTGVWGIDKTRLHATYFEGDTAEGLEPDTEAARLWRELTDIEPDHIHPGGKKDNFWEMGDTGPCGPCSEIHIDLTPDRSGHALVNAGDARVIEIWNLVFIQFNRGGDGRLSPLPARHVDTGMGFERLCAVLQGKTSNYDTDVFAPIFAAIQKRTGAPDYRGSGLGARDPSPESRAPSPVPQQALIDVSYRVIADHVRCLTFALTDGAVPSNDGRGYVLRRILRRAVRYGRQYFDMREPFLCDLVRPLVDHMADAFPELKNAHGGDNVRHVADLIRQEEESFGRTLDRGIALFDMEVWYILNTVPPRSELVESYEVHDWSQNVHMQHRTRPRAPRDVASGRRRAHIALSLHDSNAEVFDRFYSARPEIPGRVAFELHDTYGFPIDLTELIASERGLAVDIAGYERLMNDARERARGKGTVISVPAGVMTITALAPSLVTHPPAWGRTDDQPKYEVLECSAQVLGWFAGDNTGKTEPPLQVDQAAALVLDRTPFYSQQGGQVSDTGVIETDTGLFEVQDTRWCAGLLAHGGVVKSGTIRAKQKAQVRVDPARRRPTMKNHTATHMLNWALREVLGPGVQQKGSLVDSDKTRFDFSHGKPMTPDEIAGVETLVNRQIQAAQPVCVREVEEAKARSINTLRAVFGEKYPDVVRVVSIGADIDEMLADPTNPRWMQYAVEFCGGTHLGRSDEAERFVLVSEEGVAKGVRRIVGITGDAARRAEAAAVALTERLEAIAAGPPGELGDRLTAIQRELVESTISLSARHRLQEKIAELQKTARQAEKQQAAASGEAVMDRVASLLSSATTAGGVTVVVGQVPPAGPDALRGAIDWIRNKTQASAVLLATAEEDKVTLIAGMSRDVVARGVKAGDLIKEIAPLVGGKGGGRPDMAQGGGTNPDAIPQALDRASVWLDGKLG